MNDSESGYRVFVRTISALVFVVTFLWAASYLFSAAAVHSSVDDIYDYLQLLQFWLLALSACYFLIAFCLGQFLWPLGPRPTLSRLFLVVLAAALILALLSPLIRKAWIETPVESDLNEISLLQFDGQTPCEPLNLTFAIHSSIPF